MKKGFCFGLILGLLFFVSCGSLVYKYYGIDVPDECYERGKLLGKQGSGGWADLSFTECEPDETTKGKCVIMQRTEFFAAKTELEQVRQALKDCQKNCE